MRYEELAQLRDAARRAQAAAPEAAAYRSALAGGFEALDPHVPLLMLPMRLETRFRPAANAVELLIRVYPDDVHLDGHERALTAAEVRAGEDFWRATWSATSEAERLAAWKQLVDRVGATRGAWVSRLLTPTNTSGTGQEPVFPTPAQQVARWTRAVQADALPDSWVALAYRDGVQIATAAGGLIDRPLAAGPAPVQSADLTDPGMRWMVEFPAAVDAGMGLVMNLRRDQAAQIDLLLVVGVRSTESATDGTHTLTALLDAHRYTWGLDLVPQGTPTNNTREVRAGYHSQHPDGIESGTGSPGGAVGGAAGASAGDGSDAAALADALGVAGLTPFPFAGLAHSGLRDQAEAADMATLLWPATWGYFFTQMMRPLFAEADLEAWRRWVNATVRGRGPLPAIRVGVQPYGVLPVTSLDRWRPMPDNAELLVLRSFGRGQNLLRVLWDLDDQGGWTDLADVGDIPVADLALGTSLASADVDGDGRAELVVGWLRQETPWAGFTLLRLDASGTVPSMLGTGEIPADVRTTALSVAVANATGSGLDLVVVAQEESRLGRRGWTTVRVGAGLGADGTVVQWHDPVPVRVLNSGELLLGAAMASLDGRRPSLVLLTRIDDILRYRVGVGLGSTGEVGRWADPVEVLRGEIPPDAGGIAVADVDHDGAVELVVHYAWNGGGTATGAYRVGDELDGDGRPGRWLGPYNTGSAMPGTQVAGGCAVAAVGRSGTVGWRTTTGQINLLIAARQIWRSAAADAVQVGDGNVDQTLLDLLATDATAVDMTARPLLGPELAGSLWFAVGQQLDGSYQTDLEQRFGALLERWGLLAPPRVTSFAYADEALPLRFPAVVGGAPSETEPVDYLRDMHRAIPQELHDRWIEPDAPLLARLVRHSLLQAYADAAFRLVPVQNAPPPPPMPEPELVDLANIDSTDPVTPANTLTSWRHLAGATLNGRPVSELLYKAARGPTPSAEVRPLAEVLDAVRRLAGVPSAALERLLKETLDLASHRLDAWITAVATQRLQDLRQQRPAGVQLGGYGLVTDLRPAAGPASTGYVHAPSIGHGATAAVLRSGYLSHDGTALAVDLSSARVRLALELVDGVRQGQPLGALLGYRFERDLHDRNLAQHLPAMRQLAPQATGLLTALQAGTPVQAVAGLATVDGLQLLRIWQEDAIRWGSAVPGQPQPLPAGGTTEQEGLLGALRVLKDAVDAVADLGVAESVHHALQGRHLRAGGSLDALSRGELPPPDPEVVRTPRTGTAVTHRVLLLLPDPAQVPALSDWPGTAEQRALWVRAAAEPRLNAWAAAVLGDPARVRWRARYVDAVTGEQSVDHPDRELTLADAGLCPLDVLYAESPASASLTDTDLGRRLLGHAATLVDDADPPVRPVLVIDPAPGWPTTALTLSEILTIVEVARDLAAGGRPADARDLGPAGRRRPAGVHPTDLTTRAGSAVNALQDAVDAVRQPFAVEPAELVTVAAAFPGSPADVPADLACLLDLPSHLDLAVAVAALDRPSSDDLEEVRAGLVRLAAFGLAGAAPRSLTADDAARADLVAQARTVATEAADRLAASARAADTADRLSAVFGPGFVVLPSFAVDPPDDLVVARRARLHDAPEAVVEEWFEGVARVRAGARRLHDLRLVAEIAGGTRSRGLAVLQLPAQAGDRWVGLPLAPLDRLPGGVTALAVDAPVGWDPVGWDPTTDQAGLVVDEWVEVVPNGAETTSLIFHYDAPAACAPQALLLAVSPDPSRPWDLDTLAAVLTETVDCTRIRTVGPQHLRTVGHFVPALFLARNVGGDPAGDTISTLLVR